MLIYMKEFHENISIKPLKNWRFNFFRETGQFEIINIFSIENKHVKKIYFEFSWNFVMLLFIMLPFSTPSKIVQVKIKM